MHATQDELVLGRNVVGGHDRDDRMARLQLEGCGHLSLLRALPHQSDVAAGAEREGKGIEQDGLAGAGLARKHGQAGRKVDVEPVDQDDIAN